MLPMRKSWLNVAMKPTTIVIAPIDKMVHAIFDGVLNCAVSAHPTVDNVLIVRENASEKLKPSTIMKNDVLMLARKTITANIVISLIKLSLIKQKPLHEYVEPL